MLFVRNISIDECVEKKTIMGSGKAFKREKLAPLFVYSDMEGITTNTKIKYTF